MPDVILITTDLMFSSRAMAAAQQAGVKLQVTGQKEPEAVATGACMPQVEATAPRLVILDLSTVGAAVQETVLAWRGAPHPPGAILAYGPHVHEARLEAARSAGCDRVLTKGQFDAQMSAILLAATSQ